MRVQSLQYHWGKLFSDVTKRFPWAYLPRILPPSFLTGDIHNNLFMSCFLCFMSLSKAEFYIKNYLQYNSLLNRVKFHKQTILVHCGKVVSILKWHSNYQQSKGNVLFQCNTLAIQMENFFKEHFWSCCCYLFKNAQISVKFLVRIVSLFSDRNYKGPQ